MTQQSSDIIIFQDKRFLTDEDLLTNKVNGKFPNELIKSLIHNNDGRCTDCRKGYYASWEILNNKLYLTSLELAGTDKKLNLELLFQEPEFKLENYFNRGKIVFANWVTGELKLIDPTIIGDYDFMTEDKDCHFLKCNQGIFSKKLNIFSFVRLDEKYKHETNFLKKIQSNTNLTTKNNNISKAQQLFSIVLGGIDFIENEPYENGLTLKGRYEVILFNSHIALGEYKNINPHGFERDFEEYHNILIHYAKSLNLGLDKNEMLLFFDSRYKFYYNEMEDLTDGSGTYIPGRVYSAFYLTPLVNEPEMIYDLVVLIPFTKTIVNLVKWIYNEVPKLKE